jgi:hypothetical protein
VKPEHGPVPLARGVDSQLILCPHRRMVAVG